MPIRLIFRNTLLTCICYALNLPDYVVLGTFFIGLSAAWYVIDMLQGEKVIKEKPTIGDFVWLIPFSFFVYTYQAPVELFVIALVSDAFFNFLLYRFYAE